MSAKPYYWKFRHPGWHILSLIYHVPLFQAYAAARYARKLGRNLNAGTNGTSVLPYACRYLVLDSLLNLTSNLHIDLATTLTSRANPHLPTTIGDMSLQISEDGSVGEMWKDALEEFEKSTPRFKGIALSTTAEELRKTLEALNEDGKEDKKSRSSRLKDIGLKVLEVVKSLEGVAAGAASTIFGPAQVCFGALSIFLSIPGKVREFHEFIEVVFIEFEPVLSQFDIYINMEKKHTISDPMRNAIHRVMASFVKLCATVVGLQEGGKWDRFKKHASRVLDDNKELRDELNKFKRIVNGLQNVQDTETYRNVVAVQRSVDGIGVGQSEMQVSVKKLVEDQTKRNRDEKKKEWLLAIRKSLGIEDDSASPKPRQEEMASNRLEDTGNWLLNDDRFKKWADRKHAGADSILFLTGNPGFGKSSLISAVVDHLRKQASRLGQGHRSLVSFYFLSVQNDRKISPENTAETALKWIALQLAEQDDALCKALATLLADHRANDIRTWGFARLWGLLKLGDPSDRTTNYLIFDDVDKFSDLARKQFANILAGASGREWDQCSLKILVCGNFDPKTLSNGRANQGSTIRIDVESMKDDFRAYINKQLLERNMLPGQECDDLRLKLEGTMLETPGCSFRTIDIAMKGIRRAIATSAKEEDLLEAVRHSTQDQQQVMNDTLAQLQVGLRPSQIKLINEILIWVVFGNDTAESVQFDVSYVEAGLRLRGVTLPIGGLANFITRETRGLMHTENLGRTIVLEEGAKKALVKPRVVPRQREPPRISLEVKMVNTDLPIARQFFWDLTIATTSHFDLSANSPNAEASNLKGTITINKADAHLAIVEATLDFLKNPPTEETENIGRILIANLGHNLKTLYEATDLEAIDDRLKINIGGSIFDLFADPNVVKRHWKTFEPQYEFLGEKSMSEIWKWLEDDKVTGALGTKDKEWLRKRRDSSDKTQALVEDVIEMIARLWLEDPEPHDTAFRWIREFLTRVCVTGSYSSFSGQRRSDNN